MAVAKLLYALILIWLLKAILLKKLKPSWKRRFSTMFMMRWLGKISPMQRNCYQGEPRSLPGLNTTLSS
jgi:hypothetical protein